MTVASYAIRAICGRGMGAGCPTFKAKIKREIRQIRGILGNEAIAPII